ncbi:hypothetical protein LCGC14_2001630 [marine sediment metagenome]|uniref:Uncharacterized protein n=1 Tax=marine sediment metagenome TaxID=412755 RepID=A0A0F9I073_9ZZZZ
MVRERTNNEYTTIRVRWKSKKQFLKMAIGREIEADLFERILKKFNIKEIKEERVSPQYVPKLNEGKQKR